MKNQHLYEILTYIPSGFVATYGQLANYANIKSPRSVGQVLHRNPDPERYPCHRVVFANGLISDGYAFGGKDAQKEKLLAENVKIANGKVIANFWQPSKVLELYFKLLSVYGDPGQWPWFNTDSPHTSEEIAIGSILTQNTNWKNVQRVIDDLRQLQSPFLEKILEMPPDKLKLIIKPTRYQNQKCEYLKNFCGYIIKNHESLRQFFQKPLNHRTELLSIKGIGPETADTILLYCGNKTVFVIDAYTKSFAKKHLSMIEDRYDKLQNYFSTNLPQDFKLFQKYHALIVRAGQQKF